MRKLGTFKINQNNGTFLGKPVSCFLVHSNTFRDELTLAVGLAL